MARHIEEPVTTQDGESWREETKTTHPAFAQIRASRVSGSTALYGSDFRHQHYMTVTICRSQLMRNLHRDWHFGRDELIEVAMTESQWATFVSSPGMGDGVPCTLESYGGEMIPGLPDPTSRADQFAGEIKKGLEKTVARVQVTIDEINSMGLPKAKAAILKRAFEGVLRDLKLNMPFVAEQFEEHMEDTVEAAKQEVHGYMTGVLTRAGIGAIGGNMPLQIERMGGDE